MTRVLLGLLFFFMLFGDIFGLNFGIAPGLSVKNAFLYLIFASIAIETALIRNRKLELLSVTVPYSLCIFYAFTTWLILVLFEVYPGYNPLRTFINLKGGIIDHILVFLVFFYGVLNRKDVIWLLKLMIWLVIAANVISVIDGLNVPDLGLIQDVYHKRLIGPIGDPNQYAALLVLFFPAVFALALIQVKGGRLFALLGIVASMLALVMTASRGGLVGIALGAGLTTFYLRRIIPRKVLARAVGVSGAILIIAIGVLYAAGFGSLFYDLIVEKSISGTSFDVSSGRNYIWGRALGEMLDQPHSLVVGFGWNAYPYFPEFRYAPHNSYLKIFFDLGIVGILLVGITFLAVLKTARQSTKQLTSDEGKFLASFVFGYLAVLVAIFFVDIPGTWVFIWAYTGAAMRLAVLEKHPLSSEEGGKLRDPVGMSGSLSR